MRGGDVRRAIAACWSSVLLAAFVAAFGGGCALPRRAPVPPEAGAPAEFAAAVAARENGRWLPFPENREAVERLAPDATLVVVASRADGLLDGISPTAIPALQAWLEGGGRLLLFGFATRLVHELGIEARPPDRCEAFRWGWDQRTREGVYEFGFRVMPGAPPPMVEVLERALRPDPDHMRTYYLGGGCPTVHQACLWEAYPPGRGVVLGMFARERDGVFAAFDAASLTYWKVGEGAVFGCSHVPEPQSAAPGAAENATALAAALARLGRPGFDGSDLVSPLPGSLWLVNLGDAERPRAMGPRELAPLGDRPVPGQPLAGGWGWEFGPRLMTTGDRVQAPLELVDEVLLPSWRAGATRAVLRLGAADGYPIAWPEGDPIRRPDDYTQAFWSGWSADAVGSLAAEAHRRGMDLGVRLEPVPAGGADLAGEGGAAALGALRFLARELADARGLGTAAIDGFGLGPWPRDGGATTLAVVEAYHPGAEVHTTSLDQELRPGVVPVADARWGQPAGVPAAGTSDRWRPPPGGQAVARLDAGEAVPADGVGGGSFGDWIVAQANAFVRRSLGRGPVFWWSATGEAQDRRTRAYVEGVSMDPLRAAVAGRFTATGIGGWRDLLASLYAPVQAGFGAEVPVPASTPFLQNNYLRLYGTAGGLELDVGGLARFGPDAPGSLSLARPFFVQTRYRGQVPQVPTLSEPIRFLGDGGGAPGQWGERVHVEWNRQGRNPVPQGLGRAAAPRWPEAVTIEFSPPPGHHELHVTLRAESGRGILALRREGEVVELLPFGPDQEPHAHRLPFPVARGGMRTLTLEVMHGGAVLLEDLRLVQVADLGTEVGVGERAGHRAELVEWTRSSDVETVTTLTAVADLPAFTYVVERASAAPNLQALRTFHLADYRRVGTALDRDGKGRMRGGFVLYPEREGLPPLAVVPFQLSRHEFFAMGPEGLELRSQATAHTALGVGFVFLTEPAWRDRAEDELLRELAGLFVDMARPQTLDLSGGDAVVERPVPFPWVRTLRLVGGSPSPVMVEERGVWTLRGVQASNEGGGWLRTYVGPGSPRVRVRGGGATVRGTRPGPGSGLVLGLVDPEPDAVVVRVLQPHAILSQPSVMMGAPFDEVRINGEPWACFRDQEVFLPPAPGLYRVETRVHGVGREPHVAASRAPVLAARWTPKPGIRGAGVLEVLFDGADGRPVDGSYAAWVVGPAPARIEGAVRVAERELSLPPARAGRAEGEGIVIRFRPGVVRLHYE